jgi:hypothetical protein
MERADPTTRYEHAAESIPQPANWDWSIMASSREHTNETLANRLADYADAVENPAAHELEMDLRAAAAALRELENPTPLIPKLTAELKRLATFSIDPEARAALRALLREA